MKKKLTIIVLIVIVGIVAMLYITFFTQGFQLFKKNLNSTLGNQNSKNNEKNLSYSDENGLFFYYPSDYVFKIEDKNLPPDNEKNIYLVNIKYINMTESSQVQIGLYRNPNNLSIKDYIDYLKEKSVIVLLGIESSGGLDEYYKIVTKEVGDNNITEYVSRQTGERTAFFTSQGRIIIVHESGDNQEIQETYDLILGTISIK